MIKMKNCLELEEMQLRQNIENLQNEIDSSPDGVLNIQHNNGLTQFYYFTAVSPIKKDGHHKLKYIPKKDIEFARQLAQKKYDAKLLKHFEKKYIAIQKVLNVYDQEEPTQIFEDFSDFERTRSPLTV